MWGRPGFLKLVFVAITALLLLLGVPMEPDARGVLLCLCAVALLGV